MRSHALPAALDSLCRLEAARIHLAQGRFGTAGALLDGVPADDVTWAGDAAVRRHAVAAELAVWQDRPADALAAAERAVAMIGDRTTPVAVGWSVAIGVRAAADLADLARAQRDPAGAGAAVARATTVAGALDRLPDRDVPAGAWRRVARAELTRLHGHTDPAGWQATVDGWQALGDRWHLGYCRYRLAEALITTTKGGRVDAGTHLGQAWQLAADLAAVPLTTMIEGFARRARIAVAPAPQPGTTVVHDPANGTGLTSRELDVLVLVAAGRTNAAIAAELFVSEKTVDTHVSRVLRKLGATRRTEAAFIAHRLGLVTGG